MSFLAPILAGAAGSLVSPFMGGGSSSSSSNGLDAASNALLQEQQAQFETKFELQTHQAMFDNDNATKTAIAQSHAQTATSSTAGARQVGEAQAKIVVVIQRADQIVSRRAHERFERAKGALARSGSDRRFMALASLQCVLLAVTADSSGIIVRPGLATANRIRPHNVRRRLV